LKTLMSSMTYHRRYRCRYLLTALWVCHNSVNVNGNVSGDGNGDVSSPVFTIMLTECYSYSCQRGVNCHYACACVKFSMVIGRC
jgi:hypothetical protein